MNPKTPTFPQIPREQTASELPLMPSRPTDDDPEYIAALVNEQYGALGEESGLLEGEGISPEELAGGLGPEGAKRK
jgi:hypothetical protein